MSKELVTLFLLFISFTCISSKVDVNYLKKEVSLINHLINNLELNRPLPSDYLSYLTEIHSYTNIIEGYISTSDPDPANILKMSSITDTLLQQQLISQLNSHQVGIFQKLSSQKLSSVNHLIEFFGSSCSFEDGKVYYYGYLVNSQGNLNNNRYNYGLSKPSENDAKIILQILQEKALNTARSRAFEQKEKLEKQIDENTPKEEPSTQTTSGSKILEKKEKFVKSLENYLKTPIYRPSGYEALITNFESYTEVNMDIFKKNDLSKIVEKYNLPQKVYDDLKILSYSSEPIASSEIAYKNQNGEAELEEIIGYAEKESDEIFFGLFRSVGSGTLMFRKEAIKKRVCKKKIFAYYCYDELEYVDIVHTPAEVQIVEGALSAMNYNSFKNMLRSIGESQTIIGKDGKLSSSDGNYIAKLSQNGLINVSKNNVVVYLIGNYQTELNAPYGIQVRNNGNIYIVNKNDDKVWSSDTSNKGTSPYRLVLENSGCLVLYDVNNSEIYKKCS